MKNFIIQYNPHHTIKRMFNEFEQAIGGKKSIQPKNIMIVSDWGVVSKLITKPCLELLTCLQEKNPNNFQELANLLNRDYNSVQEDIQVLSSLEIIKLKKMGKEIKPIALYKRIVFDLPVKEDYANSEKKLVLFDK